ncbi:MAG: carbohydrate ABC transporter permease [Armatimonadetes bacterium]|nr:carbohydrate ABC transporter permease [Armatimonadota bacterium]
MRILIQTVKYLLILLGAVAMAFPFYWMIITSFKPDTEALQVPPTLWPRQWTVDNYRQVFELVPMGRYLFNSAFIATAVTAGVLLSSALAAHAFVRMRFPGRGFFFAVLIATMMIPFEVLLIPDYLIIRNLGWYDTYWAMIIPWTASVFGIFLLRQAFLTLPEDLWEAVLLDGGGHLRYLFSVAIPLSVPALITVGIVSFLGSWNSLLWPLIVTNTPELRPVQVGLSSFQTEAGLRYNLSMAAATISIVPILVLYLIAQRYFVEGIARTGMKT